MDDLIPIPKTRAHSSAQKHAEEAPCESEERYRRLVDLSPVSIFVNLHGRFVFLNAAAVATFGASTPEEMIGKEVLDFVGAEHREIVQARIKSMIEGEVESVPLLQESFLRLDGSRIDAEVTATRITYRGEPAALLVVFRDITERVKSEAALRESEAKYKNLVEITDTGYLIVDELGQVLDANAEYVRETGRGSLEEIKGRSVLEWTAPYDLERNEREVRKCMEQGFVRDLEIDYISPDGVITPIEINATVIETDEGLRILTLCRDITGRREAEEALNLQAQIMDQIHDSVIATDMDGYVKSWNMGAERLYAYTSEEAFGKHISFLYAEEDSDFLRDKIIATLIERGMHEVVARCRRKSGEEIYVQLLLSLLRDKSGQPSGMLGYSIDVTERRQAEERLRESERRFRTLVERAADSLYLHDLTGRFVEVNQMACDTLGYSREELLELQVADVVVGYDSASLNELWNNLVNNGPVTVLTTHRRKDGSTFPVEGRLSPFQYDDQTLILALVRDTTERQRAAEERLAVEQRSEEQKRQFYRETIRSVTDGKLDICDDSEIERFTKSADLVIAIHNVPETSDARHKAEEFLRAHGLTGERLDLFIVGVGEAITNAVKHGEEGIVYAGTGESTIWIAVTDRGNGIESLILPRAVLLRGYSTKSSLGLGYSIMLDVADHVLLKTGERGTTVILVKELEGTKIDPASLQLPDTWDSISS